jgi:hypothetical protein
VSEDERIARLRELARRVWPDASHVEIETWNATLSVDGYALVRLDGGEVVLDVDAPSNRCLAALEAALIVLVHGEEAGDIRAAYRDGFEAGKAMAAARAMGEP